MKREAGTFVEVPLRIRDLEISLGAKALLWLLCTFAGYETGECYPGLSTLAKALRVHRSSVKRYVTELRRKKLIAVEPPEGKVKPKRTTSKYKLAKWLWECTEPPGWVHGEPASAGRAQQWWAHDAPGVGAAGAHGRCMVSHEREVEEQEPGDEKKTPRPGQKASRAGLLLPCCASDRNPKTGAVETFDAFWSILPKRISRGRARLDAFVAWKSLAPAVRQRVHQCVAESLAEDDSFLYTYAGGVAATPAQLITLAQLAMAEARPLWEVMPEDDPLDPLGIAAVASTPPAPPRAHEEADYYREREALAQRLMTEQNLSAHQAEERADAELARRPASPAP
jgi:Helix-turn-helix domain